MHEVMTRLMNIRRSTEHSNCFGAFNPFIEARKLKDLRFHDRVLAQEHVDR